MSKRGRITVHRDSAKRGWFYEVWWDYDTPTCGVYGHGEGGWTRSRIGAHTRAWLLRRRGPMT